MTTVGQDEVVVLLECLPEEQTLPSDMFKHFQSIYVEASRGEAQATAINDNRHNNVLPFCVSIALYGF